MSVEDIYLDEDMRPVVTAQGECVMASGVGVILQDIKLRLMTPLGSLFYDRDFGSNLHLFINDENTAINRQSLIMELEQRIDLDKRVIPLSVSAEIISWDEVGVSINVSFRLYQDETEYFLHIAIGDDTVKVVDDVKNTY